MEPLQILATNDSPAINFNPDKEKFMVVGNSMPENAVGFYKQVIDWLKQYTESPNKITEFVFQMNLLNTSSSKIFSDIFKMINTISKKSEVKVLWYYNYGDEDIQEVGVDFKEFSKLDFELVPVADFEL
ncbi:MAG: DUF1987 domain-containing protein [Bacteroidales bacterium]|jgi:hypothetical protein|nr:DUF1987 domain-containing protein [Bacteroidales bacterium]